MIKKGVYAATLSVLNENRSLNVEETIAHAENIIKKGLSVRKILYLFIGLNIIVFLTIAATIIFDSFANIAFLSYIIIISYLFFYFQKLEPLN